MVVQGAAKRIEREIAREDDVMTVGERIQDLRKKKGFSQEKLAEYLNMSRQAVAKWEQNVCEPNLDCLATGVCV